MSGFANLADQIVERRIKYVDSLMMKVSTELTGDLAADLERFVTLPLKNADSNPYFKRLYSQLTGPVTGDNLQKIPEIATITRD